MRIQWKRGERKGPLHVVESVAVEMRSFVRIDGTTVGAAPLDREGARTGTGRSLEDGLLATNCATSFVAVGKAAGGIKEAFAPAVVSCAAAFTEIDTAVSFGTSMTGGVAGPAVRLSSACLVLGGATNVASFGASFFGDNVLDGSPEGARIEVDGAVAAALDVVLDAVLDVVLSVGLDVVLDVETGKGAAVPMTGCGSGWPATPSVASTITPGVASTITPSVASTLTPDVASEGSPCVSATLWTSLPEVELVGVRGNENVFRSCVPSCANGFVKGGGEVPAAGAGVRATEGESSPNRLFSLCLSPVCLPMRPASTPASG